MTRISKPQATDEQEENARKPLGKKLYGSIPHLVGSRRGPSDYGVEQHQHDLVTLKTKSRRDYVIVLEKLDGSNMGVVKTKDGGLLPSLTRAGYLSLTSPYAQHRAFERWFDSDPDLHMFFMDLLAPGESAHFEWLLQVHGTHYNLTDVPPFAIFDIKHADGERMPWTDVQTLVSGVYPSYSPYPRGVLPLPRMLHMGGALSIDAALQQLGRSGHHKADKSEGVVYRYESPDEVKFLAKYVRPEKVDGRFMEAQIPQKGIDDALLRLFNEEKEKDRQS